MVRDGERARNFRRVRRSERWMLLTQRTRALAHPKARGRAVAVQDFDTELPKLHRNNACSRLLERGHPCFDHHAAMSLDRLGWRRRATCSTLRPVTREQLLLLFLTRDGRQLDPVRIMKAMFLFTMEDREHQPMYTFEAYHYGPFTTEVYRDLELLTARGLVTEHPVIGRSWCIYEPTSTGTTEGNHLAEAQPDLASYLHKLKMRVSSMGFQDLLREIYTAYPEFAVRSRATNLRH